MDELQYNRHVGSRIKEMRKSRKMTLKELGEHIGLSESNTKRYEDGQIKTVGIDIIKKIALALDVPASYLTGWEDIPQYQKLSNYVPIIKKKIPLLGEIAAGQPIYADEHIEEFVVLAGKEENGFAVVRVLGNDMNPTHIMNMLSLLQKSQVDMEQLKPLQQLMK